LTLVMLEGLNDIQRTMNALQDVWHEFQHSPVPGLLSNVVCVFTNIASQGLAKEINFSVWETARDAYEWYVHSPGHKRVMHQHSSGLLMVFGNLLASLAPTKLHHSDRCRRCARQVLADDPGGRPPTHCSVCGGATFRYPLF